jgi:hypothetical protein
METATKLDEVTGALPEQQLETWIEEVSNL